VGSVEVAVTQVVVPTAVGLVAAVRPADSAEEERMVWHVVSDQAKIAPHVESDAGVAEEVELSRMWELGKEVMRRKLRIITSAMEAILVAREGTSRASSPAAAF